MRAIAPAFYYLLLAATAVAGFWLVSWMSLDLALDRQASQRVEQAKALDTPFSWSFDAASDIVVRGTRGLELTFTDGGLQGQALEPSGYLLLRLPRPVDSRFYPRLWLDLCLDQAGTVMLAPRNDLRVEQPARAGCQTLSLALPPGVYRQLRLHPAQPAGASFTLNQAHLPRAVPATATPLQTTQPGWWPGSLLSQRAALAQVTPETILVGPLPGGARLTPPVAWLLLVLFLPILALVWLPHRVTMLTMLAAASLGAGVLFAPPLWASGFVAVAVAVLLVWLWNQRMVAAQTLFRAGGLGAWAASGVLVLAGVMVLALSFEAHTRQNVMIWQGLVYLAWALCQQLFLGPLLAGWLAHRSGQGVVLAAVSSGMIFGALHLPNLALALATWLAGSVWAWVYLRYRCLLPQILSHAALGLVVGYSGWFYSARIGQWFLAL